jgi:acetolactate synthase-1/2/3 large subunit
MSSVSGAVLLARSLAEARVGPIFTLSGNQILPVYDAGLDAGLRFVDGRHESAVAHMADAWGRLTGRPGVCLVTAGPGHTNALTGLVTAQLAESPMLLLSGGS